MYDNTDDGHDGHDDHDDSEDNDYDDSDVMTDNDGVSHSKNDMIILMSMMMSMMDM